MRPRCWFVFAAGAIALLWLLRRCDCGRRLLDEVSHCCRLRDVHGVAGRHLGYSRPGPLGHGALDCRGDLRSSVVTMYQLGLVRQAGSVTCSEAASTPQGTSESAMNAARPAGRSAPNDV